MVGDQRPVHWSGPAGEFDFFSLKGVFESLLSRLKLSAEFSATDTHPALHPGATAVISLGGEEIGFIGQVNPGLAQGLELPQELYFLELYLEPLLSAEVTPTYQERSPFPGIRRDLSILVDENIPCAALINRIKKGSPLVAEVTVFDLYQGKQLPPDKRSLAMSVLFQSRERTLRDEEVDEIFGKIFKDLVKTFGIKPR